MSITAAQLHTFLPADQLVGDASVEVWCVKPPDDAAIGALSWLKPGRPLRRSWNGSVLICSRSAYVPTVRHPHAILFYENPRLAFAKLVRAFFASSETAPAIHETAVIGAEGIGYVWDSEADRYVSMPHLAGVSIGSCVDIGPFAVVMRGVLRNTTIGEGTKIGNHVTIGHGAHVGKHCIIAPGARLGGSSTIGDHVHVYMNAVVCPSVTIGDHAVIAAGAVATRDILKGGICRRNPLWERGET